MNDLVMMAFMAAMTPVHMPSHSSLQHVDEASSHGCKHEAYLGCQLLSVREGPQC